VLETNPRGMLCVGFFSGSPRGKAWPPSEKWTRRPETLAKCRRIMIVTCLGVGEVKKCSESGPLRASCQVADVGITCILSLDSLLVTWSRSRTSAE